MSAHPTSELFERSRDGQRERGQLRAIIRKSIPIQQFYHPCSLVRTWESRSSLAIRSAAGVPPAGTAWRRAWQYFPLRLPNATMCVCHRCVFNPTAGSREAVRTVHCRRVPSNCSCEIAGCVGTVRLLHGVVCWWCHVATHRCDVCVCSVTQMGSVMGAIARVSLWCAIHIVAPVGVLVIAWAW